jgi:hypothetical protein
VQPTVSVAYADLGEFAHALPQRQFRILHGAVVLDAAWVV